ncbi:MAG: TVP38/TMEM64 family protein [Halanaeroarchaeum sp.]
MPSQSARPLPVTLPSGVRALALAGVLFLAALAAGAMWVGDAFAGDPAAIRRWIADFGVLAPTVLIAGQALQVVIAPIPGQVLGLVAGYLFGPVYGTAYSLTGAAIGSLIAFSLSRRYGRPFVLEVVDPATVQWFDEASERRGYQALFLAFLVPGLPDDLICFVAGLSRMNRLTMTAVSVVGRLPGYYLIAVGGADVATGKHLRAAVLLGVLAVLSLLGYRHRNRFAALRTE